jgi:hypothetical protein
MLPFEVLREPRFHIVESSGNTDTLFSIVVVAFMCNAALADFGFF